MREEPEVTCKFPASERIKSRKQAERLFMGGENRSFSAYPVRIVYRKAEQQGEEGIRTMMSVSKHHFKSAVKRNRVKRQLREAYRLNKHLVEDHLAGRTYDMAFIWQADELYDSKTVEGRVVRLLRRMGESI